jgi:ATP-binding cassette subfamily B protein
MREWSRRLPIRKFWPHVQPILHRHGRLFFLGILALLATDATQLLIPWFTRLTLDNLNLSLQVRRPLALFPALILLAAVAQGVFRYFWRTRVFGFSRHIEWDLRNRLFAHLQRLPSTTSITPRRAS